MTSILRDWLKKANIEWETEKKLEDVFSNGYRIAELLCNLNVGGLNQEVFEEQFADDVTIEAMTENYKLIAQYLCDGGIDIKPKLLRDIASNVSGAIHRFIYDLKCFMDRTERETMSQITDPNNTVEKIGTSSFKSPPRISSPTRNRKYQYEDMQKRDIELKIRKLATEQFHKRSELKWKKYRDHAAEMEQSAKMENEFEVALKNERVLQHHDVLVKTLKNTHQKREDDDKRSKKNWIKNQKLKQKRIVEKKHFESTQNLKKLKKQNVKRNQTANECEQALDEFENILNKTQRLQKNDAQENQASELQANDAKDTKSEINDDLANEVEVKEDPLEHLEKLRQALPEQTVSMKKTQTYLQQVKINVAKQREEAMKREQRRKKLIADEMALNQEKAQNDRKKEIDEIIGQSSEATKSFDDKIKTIKLNKKIFTQNSNFIKQQNTERKQKDKTLKLKRDKEHFAIKRVEFKTKLTIETQKLKELKLKQDQHQHVKNIKYCKSLVGSIVDITYKSVLYRQLSDTKNIPNALWSEWMQCLASISNRSKTQHILSNIDQRNALEKEKRCHSDIIHIKNGLIECMDIHGSINRALINETELKNYLNAQGIWSYDDHESEPSTDKFGAIIKEIVAVSEGPNPRYQKIIPDVPIAIAFIGKPFVGKTTQSQQIADKYALQIIDTERCIKDAMDAFEKCVDAEPESLDRTQTIGQKLKDILQDGKEVSDELYIDVIFDAILSVQEDKQQNGWILDGFPMRRSQCELLEAKLTGFVDDSSPKANHASEDAKIESGLDFVFYLDVNESVENADEILFNRAKGRLVDKVSGRIYHIADNPPPGDKAIKEQLIAPPDEQYVAALPEHFKAFSERKEELQEWFHRFGTWTELNCDQDRDELTLLLLDMIEKRIRSKKQKEEQQTGTSTIEQSPWNQYLKDQNMCQRLHYLWCNVEESYTSDLKKTFELLRHERRRILAYLASTREYFYNFLRRADGKQAIIDEFQNEYNDIPRDMRRDDDTKNELHQRTQELSFKLFESSMKRKNQSIEELDTIKQSVWLPTEHNTLLNILLGVIHCEFNRYIPTINLIKDYFAVKNNESISEESIETIDLLSIVKQNSGSQKGNKAKKGKEDINATQILMDHLQNAINLGLEQIVECEQNRNENEQLNELQCNIIKEENERYKMRLLRLNKILNFYVREVEDRHLSLLQKLDQWIGLRIDSENEAITLLVNHIQEAIETESELIYRLTLEKENFLIDRDVIVCPMPDPIQIQKANHELSTKGVFSAKQLKQLIDLLRSQNVNGIIEYKSISEIFKRLSTNTYAQNEPILPTTWNNMSDAQLYLLFSSVIVPYSANKYVNWKLFIVSTMLQTVSIINNKVAVPSLDSLFDLKQAFDAKDSSNSAKLNQKQFGDIRLWFDNSETSVWKNILFDLFEVREEESEQNEDTEKLMNYNQLLFHLCFNDQSHFGFEKVVSLSENINLIQSTQQVTNQCVELIQLRGTNNVEIENGSEIANNDGLTVELLKQNEDIIASFNFVNIEQLLCMKQ